MSQLDTFQSLFSQSGAQFWAFDMGRKVARIPSETFNAIDTLNCPYPFPINGQAKFALLFANQGNAFVWFLSLPVDEKGIIDGNARYHFIHQVVAQLGTDPSQTMTEEQQKQVDSSPYIFKPDEVKLAQFNAFAKKALANVKHEQYLACVEQLHMKPKVDWQELALQPLAEVALNINEHQRAFMRHYDALPDGFKHNLLQLLESSEISDDLALTLLGKISAQESNEAALLFRALSNNMLATQQFINEQLQAEKVDEAWLLLFAAKAWNVLASPLIMQRFVMQLAKHPYPFFKGIITDLALLPATKRATQMVLASIEEGSNVHQYLLQLQQEMQS